VFSRSIGSHRVPQHIQNLVIRNHAEKHSLTYMLSGVEHCMEHSFVMLNQMLSELDEIDGIILYSMFMLPRKTDEREAILDRVISSESFLHSAVEGFVLRTKEDIKRWNDIFIISNALENSGDLEDLTCHF
jgi:sporadic carbohydrate cluster protein (TIGR04323 family)